MGVVYSIPSGSSIDRNQAVGVTVDYTPGLVIGAGPSEASHALEFVFAPPPGSSPGAEGVFLYPYDQSTKVGSVFTLRRRGGMPEGWKYRCFEAKEAPEGGQAWGTIYEVDFRTLATQVISDAGSYTIDDLTWWAKGPLAAAGGATMTSGVLNGSGLYIGSNLSGPTPNGTDLQGRLLVLPLANVPDFNPSAPLIVRAKFALPGVGSNRGAYLGLIDTAADAAQYLAGAQATQLFTGTPDGTTSEIRVCRGTGVLNTQYAADITSQAEADRLVGCVRALNRYADHVAQVWDGTGAIPDVANASLNQQDKPQFKTGVHANPCVAFLYRNNQGVSFTAYMTHLSVSQPKVPA